MYFEKITKEKQLKSLELQFYKCLQFEDKVEQELFKEMWLNTFYMHDVGKCNINFQRIKMKNTYFKGKNETETNHALLSAAIYVEYFLERIQNVKIKGMTQKRMMTYVVLHAYIISKHHGTLQDFETFEEKLKSFYENYKLGGQQFELCIKPLQIGQKFYKKLFAVAREYLGKTKEGWDMAYPYIYTKLVYSMLVACDFYATSEYMQRESIECIGNLDNISEWIAMYEKSATAQAIKEYAQNPVKDLKNVQNINILRSELFLEAQKELMEHLDENIFYVEAPTGSGKTNTSIGLVLTLLLKQNKRKLFYIFPFNTLVEQTKKSLDSSFSHLDKLKKEIVVVNSITPMQNKKQNEEQEEEEINYNRILLDRQFFHYPVVITSHVQLFNLLFGCGREDGVGLYQLVNSVIVLDEIQSYKNTLWTEIIGFLKVYAQLLGIKIIIMSATLPKLGALSLEGQEPVSLIKNRNQYFLHPLFRERVQVDFSLLEVEDVYERLIECVIEKAREPRKKILVEFIKKKTAVRFYNDLVERLEGEGKQVLLLTGDDSKWEREKCIARIASQEEVILIATQLIEAGVDIDMDYGFKDSSLLDAEEQFLGRINRSCKKEGCYAYFFNLDSAQVLYKGDYRKNKELTIQNLEMQKVLVDKDFSVYYRKIFEDIKAYNRQCTKENLEIFKAQTLTYLNYSQIKERMKLIDEEVYPFTVFLGIESKIEKDGEQYVIDGKEVWEKFAYLVKNREMDYAERKVKLSMLTEKMSAFMWQVKYCDVSYTERIGDIFYIEDGAQYMTNGKFDREKLCESDFEIL